MFVLPYGHDQSVYGKQWVTYAVIALNVLVFAYTAWTGIDAEREIEDAAARVLEVRSQHPSASIDPSLLDGVPERLREALVVTVRVADDEAAPLEEGDLALEDATRDLLAAVRAHPTYRLGYRAGEPSVLAVVSSMFVHAGFWHLLGNMLFLWLAGAVIECFWDRGPFVALYLVAGAAAVLAQHLADPDSLVPLVGASGAIAGLLGAFLVGYPHTRIRVLYFFWPFGLGHFYIRAWLLIPFWALLQLFWALLDVDEGVAYWAHLGGFAVGVVGAVVMRRLGWVIEDAGSG